MGGFWTFTKLNSWVRFWLRFFATELAWVRFSVLHDSGKLKMFSSVISFPCWTFANTNCPVTRFVLSEDLGIGIGGSFVFWAALVFSSLCLWESILVMEALLLEIAWLMLLLLFGGALAKTVLMSSLCWIAADVVFEPPPRAPYPFESWRRSLNRLSTSWSCCSSSSKLFNVSSFTGYGPPLRC